VQLSVFECQLPQQTGAGFRFVLDYRQPNGVNGSLQSPDVLSFAQPSLRSGSLRFEPQPSTGSDNLPAVSLAVRTHDSVAVRFNGQNLARFAEDIQIFYVSHRDRLLASIHAGALWCRGLRMHPCCTCAPCGPTIRTPTPWRATLKVSATASDCG
jgi:hypothetical protein